MSHLSHREAAFWAAGYQPRTPKKEFLDWVHAQLKKRYEQNLKQNNKRK
jgi:hypothetical protein